MKTCSNVLNKKMYHHQLLKCVEKERVQLQTVIAYKKNHTVR